MVLVVAGFDFLALLGRRDGVNAGGEVGDVGIDHLSVFGQEHEVQAGPIDGDRGEPALAVHLSINGEIVEGGVAKGDEAEDGFAQDFKAEALKPFLCPRAGVAHKTLFLAVSFDAQAAEIAPPGRVPASVGVFIGAPFQSLASKGMWLYSASERNCTVGAPFAA